MIKIELTKVEARLLNSAIGMKYRSLDPKRINEMLKENGFAQTANSSVQDSLLVIRDKITAANKT